MSLAALASMLASSVCWAGFDVTRKQLAMCVEVAPLVMALTAAQIPIFVAWLLLGGPVSFDLSAYALPGALATLLNLVALSLFIRALSLAPLSLTVPFLALTPVLAALSSIPLLGEWPTLPQAIGIALVIAGAAVLYLWPSGTANGGERRGVLSGRLMMIGVAAIWALTGPIDKLALRAAPPALHALAQVTGISLGLAALIAIRRRFGALLQLAERPGTFLFAVALAASALGLQMVAIQLVLVSLVETVKRATGMFGSVVNGRLFFAEPLTPHKLVAAAVMSSGVALVLR